MQHVVAIEAQTRCMHPDTVLGIIPSPRSGASAITGYQIGETVGVFCAQAVDVCFQCPVQAHLQA